MSREKNFVKNTIIISLGKFMPMAFNLILVPLLTGNLSATEYGTYDLVLTIASFLLPISTLQIHTAVFRFLIDARSDAKECRTIISSSLTFVTIVAAIATQVFLLISNNINAEYAIIVSIFLYVDILYALVSFTARGFSDIMAYSISTVIVSGVKTVVAVIAIIVFGAGLKGVFTSLILGYIVAILFLFIRLGLHRYISFRSISFKRIRDMLGFSWPIVPNNLSGWVLNLSDRLVITAFLGIESNALYAAANVIPNVLNIAKSVVVLAWQENASVASKDSDASKYYTEMFSKVFAIIAGMTALVIALAPIMFKILVHGSYENAYMQVPILIMGVFYGCVAGFQGGIYLAYKRTTNAGITTLVAAGVNLLIDLTFVHVIGIYAGSISTLVSYFVLFLYRLIDLYKRHGVGFSTKTIIQYSLGLIVMVIMGSINNIYFYGTNMLVGVLFFWITNKELVIKCFNILSKRLAGIK